MKSPQGFSARDYLAPRYWVTWLGLGILWLLAHLPYRASLITGSIIGKLAYHLIPKRSKIMRRNIELCFPDKNEHEREALVRDNWRSMGTGIFETALAWWMPRERFKSLCKMEGLENFDAAIAQGKGAILLSCHTTNLEIGATAIALHRPIQAVYRRAKNKLFNAVMLDRREQSTATGTVLERHDIRGMVRSMKTGLPVWYAPDQDFGPEKSIFVPFMGIQTATVTATSRLARMSGAPILPFFPRRLPGTQGYVVEIGPALENFPSGDDEQDTRRINQLIEEHVRKAPEQYLWSHRRFKTRPPGEPPVY